MKNNSDRAKESRYFALLSSLLLGDRHKEGSEPSTVFLQNIDFVAQLSDERIGELLALADVHHVTVRLIEVIQNAASQRGDRTLAGRFDAPLLVERRRIDNALQFLNRICGALERANCPVTVIKSLDHWPDLGGDLDLYTSGDKDAVVKVFTEQFAAELEAQSWGDRLANKWNFRVPGLPELVECHVKWLGQTGEQAALARRIEQRRIQRQIGDYSFPVPAPEERIVISTLQRMYRHFYIRLCDILNISNLLRSNAINFQELKTTADMGAIWPGVATLMVIVCDYVKSYGGEEIELPPEVVSAARFSGDRTYISEKFLRIPIVPEAAGLYTNQMLGIGAHRNFRAMLRLSLLPALATAAFVGYKLTGSDKGIW
jgi:hypothetical protein